MTGGRRERLRESILGGCKSRVVGCGPDCWSIPHTVCSGGRCECGQGYQATTDSQANIISCTTRTNSSLQADQANSPVSDINIHYYPGQLDIQTLVLS